jgi:chromosome segregation ATPase
MDDYITRSDFRDALAQFERRITDNLRDMMEDRLRNFSESLRSNVRADNAELIKEVNTLAADVKSDVKVLAKEVEHLRQRTDDSLKTQKENSETLMSARTTLNNHQTTLTNLETKLGSFEQVFTTKLGGLDTKLESLDRDAKRRLWVLGLVITVLMTLVQILVRYLLK